MFPLERGDDDFCQTKPVGQRHDHIPPDCFVRHLKPSHRKGALNEIARDPRHSDIKILVEEPISKRDLGDWTMGYVGLTREQLQEVEGLNDFYNEGKCYVDMDAGQAKAILTAFLRGRWPDALAG